MGAGELAEALHAALGGRWSLRPLGAGSFCATWEARDGGQRLFVKSAPPGRAPMLEAEADGLEALAATGTVRVPRTAGLRRGPGGGLLALEWLELVPPDAGFGPRLAGALAALHAAPPPVPGFGWRRDNFLGATPQANPLTPDWAGFLAGARIGALRQRLAGRDRALDQAVDAVIALLPALFAADPRAPSLIHGDLWQGNWGMLADGTPVVFDPAVSCADAEAELAMMELFGAPPPGFAAAYARASGRGRDARRTRVYQLYHLLNHALLFGAAYARQALRLARALPGGSGEGSSGSPA